MNVLLVYPLGSRDLQRADGHPFENMSLAITTLRALTPPVASTRFRPGAQYTLDVVAADECVATLPILGDTLRHIATSTTTGGRDVERTISITLQPIASSQTPPDPRDTQPVADWLLAQTPLLREPGLRTPVGRLTITVLPAWMLSAPADQAAVSSAYTRFFSQFTEMAPAFDRRFLQLTCGTPQMSFAATTFGRDPDLRFLYTPRGAKTREVTHPLGHQRGVTEALVATLVDATDWRAAREALAQPGNGYTPLTAQPHPEAARIAVAEALHLWESRRYVDACRIARAMPSVADAPLARAAARLRFVVEPLSRAGQAANSVSRWEALKDPDVWSACLIDAYNRLLLAAVRRDTAATVLAADWFHQAWTRCAVARVASENSQASTTSRDEVARRLGIRRDKKMPSETTDFFLLLLWREQAAPGLPLVQVVDVYAPFHWVLQQVREARNDLMHSVVDFSPRLGRARWSRSAATLEALTDVTLGMIFLGLAYRVLDSLGLDPDEGAFVMPMAGALRGGKDATLANLNLRNAAAAAQRIDPRYAAAIAHASRGVNDARAWLVSLSDGSQAGKAVALAARTISSALPHGPWIPHTPVRFRKAAGPATVREAAAAVRRMAGTAVPAIVPGTPQGVHAGSAGEQGE